MNLDVKPNVLIIGCGYIGGALESHLKMKTNWLISTFNRYKTDLWEDNDYSELTRQDLTEYTHIVLTAGNSSVGNSKFMTDTFKQNVCKFLDLANILREDQQLIYISSASVYVDIEKGALATEELPLGKPSNYYDWSKQLLDKTAEMVKVPYIGLRLGTVCGYSPIRQRLDVMINRMIYSIETEGKIIVNNCDNYRAILAMKDLCYAIQTIIEHPKPPSGVYNLATLNASIGQIANTTARFYKRLVKKVEIVKTPDTGTYSFSLDCTKFKETFNFEFKESFADIVEDAMKNDVPAPEDLHKYLRN